MARRGPRLRRALWCASLLLALAGLFAMHGLGDHGAMAGPDQHVMAMAHHPGLAVPAEGAAPLLRLEPVPSGTADMSMSGLCVAVLLLGVALLLRAARRGRPVAEWRVAAAAHLVRARRSHPPPRPDLFGLSIQRC